MNVYLDYLLVVYNNNAVADSFEVSPEHERVGTVIVLFEHELSAVCKGDIVVVLAYGSLERLDRVVVLAGLFSGFRDSSAVEDLVHRLDYDSKAHTAGVDNACLFELREHILSLCENSLRLSTDIVPENDVIAV